MSALRDILRCAEDVERVYQHISFVGGCVDVWIFENPRDVMMLSFPSWNSHVFPRQVRLVRGHQVDNILTYIYIYTIEYIIHQ